MPRMFSAGRRMAIVLSLALARAALGQNTSTLKFDPPYGFLSGGDREPRLYRSINNDEALIGIYRFRPYSGDFQAEFQRTLLRDWVEPTFQEGILLGDPSFGTATVPGAQAAILGSFRDSENGVPREHLRLAILGAGSVALIDMTAATPEAWGRNWLGIEGMLKSLSVVAQAATTEVAPRPEPVGEGSSGVGIAGLYLGQASLFQFDPLGAPGSGRWALRTRYYLFSRDGRVHRGNDLPNSPAGDIQQFDYETAQREDPGNAGRYAVEGSQVTIRLNAGPDLETTVAEITPEGHLTISGTTYKKAALRE